MTTVIFDGKTLTADMQLTKGSTISNMRTKKIGRGSFTPYNGKPIEFFYGFCGDAGAGPMAVEWFKTDGWKMLPQYITRTARECVETDSKAVNSMYELMQKFTHPEADIDYELVIIIPNKGLYCVTTAGYGFVEEGVPYATGDGEQLALGAMLAGADAVEALKIASKKNVFTGVGISKLTVKK